MNRGTVPDLPSAHPLLDLLPGVYAGDALVAGFTRGLDAVLAPVFLTLDCLETYVDPHQAPEDFLPWLGSWVGVSVAETWPAERKRRVIAEAVARHRDRGTARGLRAYVEALTDGDVEVDDNGGTLWSDDPDVDPPGDAVPRLHVVVRVDDPGRVNREHLLARLDEVRPVHLPLTLDVRGRSGTQGA